MPRPRLYPGDEEPRSAGQGPQLPPPVPLRQSQGWSMERYQQLLIIISNYMVR
jgi:hypothetical protein